MKLKSLILFLIFTISLLGCTQKIGQNDLEVVNQVTSKPNNAEIYYAISNL